MPPKDRFYEIDLFRFIAAISVVMFHYTLVGNMNGKAPGISFPELAGVFKYGYLGVDLFFIISGFVILLTALQKNTLAFIKSRFLRLYPSFWVALSLTTLSTYLIGGTMPMISTTQFIANFTMLPSSFDQAYIDTVYWTLGLELKFYFFIGLLIIFRQTHKIIYFLTFWLLITLTSPYIKFPYLTYSLTLDNYSGYFIAGALFYLIRRDGLSTYKVGMIAICFYSILKNSYWHMLENEELYQTEYSIAVVGFILFFCFGLMFLVSINKAKVFNKPFMLKIGVLTYPLYLIHQNIGYQLFNYFSPEKPSYIFLIAIVFTMIITSYFIHKIIEQPLSRFLGIFFDKFFVRNRSKSQSL
ncbi:MAG: acyltransferase [Emcibacter sp.]|nr:acyltransferase [Emcibacter sp.]